MINPFPHELVIVPFPSAVNAYPAGIMGNQAASLYIPVARQEVELQPSSVHWFTAVKDLNTDPQSCMIRIMAEDNIGKRRSAEIQIKIDDQLFSCTLKQPGGYLIQCEMVRVLNSPLAIDLLIAVTFIADKIKKIKVPPVKLLVMVIIIIVMITLAILISLARHLFVDIPEPPPLSTNTGNQTINFNGIPIKPMPLADIAVTDQLIALQTMKEIYWFVRLSA